MKKESYEYTPLEVYQAIRSNRRDIAFDGFPNKVYFDESEHIANIHVSTRYEIEDNTPLEEGEEREPTKPVDELDIINVKGDYLYQLVYSSIFSLYIYEYNQETIPAYIRYITEVEKEMMRRIEFFYGYSFPSPTTVRCCYFSIPGLENTAFVLFLLGGLAGYCSASQAC